MFSVFVNKCIESTLSTSIKLNRISLKKRRSLERKQAYAVKVFLKSYVSKIHGDMKTVVFIVHVVQLPQIAGGI